MATSAPVSKRTRPRHGGPWLHSELLVEEILTRLPAAAAARSRAVCRSWNAALTSDSFIAAHAARHPPEILFFPPSPAAAAATSFYACPLPASASASAQASSTARELLTVGGLGGEHVVLSRGRPCRGLTLVLDARAGDYFVFNLSTGEHVALPPCEPAREATPLLGFPRFHPVVRPWFPFELSSTGLGFDPATAQHKAVRLFGNWYSGQQKCQVFDLGSSSSRSGAARSGWRPCAGGDAPPDVASYLDGMPPVAHDGWLYWLLQPWSSSGSGSTRESSRNPHESTILSLSVGAEQFAWVPMPAQRRRVRHLADLDGSLCAVLHERMTSDVLKLLTWSPDDSSWSARCRIDLDGLPPPLSDELSGERNVIPLCSVGAGKTKAVLLATSRHRVYAYDTERGSAEKVFDMQDYVDVPRGHGEAKLLVNIGIHEERIAAVPVRGRKRLQVKLRGDRTVVSSGTSSSSSSRDEVCRQLASGPRRPLSHAQTMDEGDCISESPSLSSRVGKILGVALAESH